MLGSTLVTKQTGPEGKRGQPPLYRGRLGIARELYLSPRRPRTSRIAFIASTEGGMDIEEVAHSTPEKIFTFTVDPATGSSPHSASPWPMRWAFRALR